MFKPSTDTAKFAERIYVDVFGCLRPTRSRVARPARQFAASLRCRSRRIGLGVLAGLGLGRLRSVVPARGKMSAIGRAPMRLASVPSSWRPSCSSARSVPIVSAALARACGSARHGSLALGVVPDAVGGGDRKIRLAAAAVLSAAAGHHRGLYRRSAKAARQRLRVGQAAARRLPDRRGGRLPHRRLDRLVAQRRLLGASGAALHRPVAGDGLAADRVLHLSLELERQRPS